MEDVERGGDRAGEKPGEAGGAAVRAGEFEGEGRMPEEGGVMSDAMKKAPPKGKKVFSIPMPYHESAYNVLFFGACVVVLIGLLTMFAPSPKPEMGEYTMVDDTVETTHVRRRAPGGGFQQHTIDLEHRGGQGDGVFDNTKIIKGIMEECKEFQCTVIIPSPGTFLTGAFELVSYLTLEIERGASLLFIPDPNMYPNIPYPEHPSLSSYPKPSHPVHSPLIRAYNLTEVRITGGGVIDGNGEWHSWEHEAPVATLYIIGCKDVLVNNIRFEESVGMAMHVQYSLAVKVVDVTIVAKETTYADGILVDSSRHVEVVGFRYEGGGLAFAIASGDGYEGRAVNIPTQDVILSSSNIIGGRGVGMLSAMAGGFRNITYSRLLLDGRLSRAHGESKSMGGVRIKSKVSVTGGHVEDILFEHIYGISLHHGIQIDMFKHMDGDYMHSRHDESREGRHGGQGLAAGRPDRVEMSGLRFKNITVEGVEDDCGAFEILEDSPIHQVHMEDVNFIRCHKPWKCGPGKVYGTALNVNPPLPSGCMLPEMATRGG